MFEKSISNAVRNRLPKYYRYVGELLDDGIEKVSSSELSVRMNISASLVRQDLCMFSGAGLQGYGYDVEDLYEKIGDAIGVNQCHNVIVIGAGNLGQALVSYMNFARNSFAVKGIFAVNSRLVGHVFKRMELRSLDNLEQFMKENPIQIAALAVPDKSAERIAGRLQKAGIKAIWNFTNTDLNLPKGIVVENVHLAESLMQLSSRMNISA